MILPFKISSEPLIATGFPCTISFFIILRPSKLLSTMCSPVGCVHSATLKRNLSCMFLRTFLRANLRFATISESELSGIVVKGIFSTSLL